jgi:hypothetical protein
MKSWHDVSLIGDTLWDDLSAAFAPPKIVVKDCQTVFSLMHNLPFYGLEGLQFLGS